MAGPAWLAARLVVGAALLFDAIVRAGTMPARAPIGTAVHRGLLSWDAARYLDLAQHGYGSAANENLRFFPVLPLAVRWLGALLHSDAVALLLISNVAALAFLVLLYRFVGDDLRDPGLARRTVWLAALAPIAFVLVMGYTEPIAGAATVAALWAARRRRWLPAAAAAAFAGALRPSGIFLVVPLLVEALIGLRAAAGSERVRRAIAVVAPALGTAPFLLWVHAVYGNWKLPYDVQQVDGLRGKTISPVTSVWRALHGLDGSDRVLGLRGLWALVFLALLVVAARRLPLSYTALAAVTLVVATATEHIGSLERYAYGAFPFLVAASTLTKRTTVERIVLVTATAAMASYALLAFLDLYVP